MVGQNLEYAMFSRGEMERRYGRARELMSERGLDGLLITGEENFHYLAGAAASLAGHYSLTRASIFILPLGREPIIVTQGQSNLALGCYVTDQRGYQGLFGFPQAEVLEAIGDAGLTGSRIGVELGLEQRMGMPVGAYLELVATLPEAEELDPRLPAVRSQPIFVAHGSHDQMIAESTAHAAKDYLEGAGYSPEFHVYNMGHEISGEVLAALVPWMASVLPPRSASG